MESSIAVFLTRHVVCEPLPTSIQLHGGDWHMPGVLIGGWGGGGGDDFV